MDDSNFRPCALVAWEITDDIRQFLVVCDLDVEESCTIFMQSHHRRGRVIFVGTELAISDKSHEIASSAESTRSILVVPLGMKQRSSGITIRKVLAMMHLYLEAVYGVDVPKNAHDCFTARAINSYFRARNMNCLGHD